MWSNKVLWINDECSMESLDNLGTSESQLRKIGDATKLFGGIGVILSGDFAQLPPIKPALPFYASVPLQIAMKRDISVMSQAGSVIWNTQPILCIIASTNHRAILDPKWADLLQRLHDNPTPELLVELNKYLQSSPIKPNTTFLCFDNEQRVALTKEINNQLFKQLMDKTSVPRTWRVHGKGVMNNLGGILEIQAEIEIRKAKNTRGGQLGRPNDVKFVKCLRPR